MDRYRNSKSKASIQNKLCRILTNIYRTVFVNDLKPYFIVIEWDDSIKTVLKTCFEESEQKYQDNEAQTMGKCIDTFYRMSGFNKKRFYEVNVQGKNSKKLFDATAINWFNNIATISGTESWNTLSVPHKINKLRKIPAIAKVESMIDYDALYEQ
eukprot:490337_1